jgi:hypothetical protein
VSDRFVNNFRAGSGLVLLLVVYTTSNRTKPVPTCSCAKAVYKPVWHAPLLSVQWITADDGQRNCPKHVEVHFQNKFEKLVHLVGFIIRMCHNARSHGCKICGNQILSVFMHIWYWPIQNSTLSAMYLLSYHFKTKGISDVSVNTSKFNGASSASAKLPLQNLTV